ncbi:hypothetical protein [Ktedonobacter robiniae]|uniref:Tetratricopeptide repeat protein n=1 Tax=Ktedonobacter robiniae TaxID=2778365 RepID=A0ABQ3UVH9_9CHLR|nr:hypothetical protein [Ktedonobacter robiniae]GHO56758.1 hypothetical protein KSB_52330 [Ktedonobacter robiniae]
MAHSLQPGAQGAQEPFDFNQIFIGREQQMAEFGRLLREWKYMLAQEEAEVPEVTELPSPRNKLPGLVVMLYGRGGFGKSTLLNRYYGIAAQANEQGLGGRLTLCGPVDWEFAVEGRRSIYNPSQGQALDPLAYYKDLCAQLASRLDRQPGNFRAYQQAVGEVEKVRHESSKILEEVRREQDDLGSALRGATIDIVASALSTYVPGSKGIVQNEKVKKGADALLQLTGEQVAYLYQRFQRRLGERLEDYLDPARRLGFALGRDLARCAANYPILIFFDTYEEIDEGDQLLRLVMAAAGPRVGWIKVADQLEQIATTDPQASTAHLCLGVALGLRGKLKAGLEELEKAIQARTTLEDAFFWKGMLCAYYYRGRPHLAIEAIEHALAHNLPPVLLRPLYWLREDNPAFFEQYARPLLERYGV